MLAHSLAHALEMLDGTVDGLPPTPGGPSQGEIDASTWENRYRLHHPPYTLRTTAGGQPLPQAAIHPDD